jgi:hypothetical protein
MGIAVMFFGYHASQDSREMKKCKLDIVIPK